MTFSALRECEVRNLGGHAQTVLDTGGGRAATKARGAHWVNILLANVKRSIGGSYHAFDQSKYARRYLGEAAWPSTADSTCHRCCRNCFMP